MVKLICFFALMMSFSSVFASLNESSKPDKINIYLEQRPPYSFFDENNNAKGVLVDYWLNWSTQNAISVVFHRYDKSILPRLSIESKSNIYSGVTLPTELVNKTIKSSSVKINTHFYYPFDNSLKVKSALANTQKLINTGGLLAEAQLLPVFTHSANIHYHQYAGLFELLLAVYQKEIDAVVFFTGENEQLGGLDSFLSLLLSKTVTHNLGEQLALYSFPGSADLVEWLQWGELQRVESEMGEMTSHLKKHSNAWWELSSAMLENVIIIVCSILLLFVFLRIKRRADKQFENIFYSSPYPLAIFSLDGSVIYYLNEEAESSFPFKSYNNKYTFRHIENQVLVSEMINKLSHKMSITDVRVRVKLDKEKYQDISLNGKRVHYKHHSAWLCYLKDITEVLQIEERKERLAQSESLLQATEKKLNATEGKLADSKVDILDKKNKLSSAELQLALFADNLTELEIKHSETEQALSITEGDLQDKSALLIEKVNELTKLEGDLIVIDKKNITLTATSIETGKSLKAKKQQCKKIEKALAKQELLLNTLFSVTIDPMALFDNKSKLIVKNNAFSELMNCKPQKVMELLAQEHCDQEILIFEEKVFCADKKNHYEIKRIPFNEPNNSVQGFFLIAREISVRKKMETKSRVPFLKAVYSLDEEKVEFNNNLLQVKCEALVMTKTPSIIMQDFLNEASNALSKARENGSNQICIYESTSNI